MMASALLFVVIALATITEALDNGVGLTPPMGWLSWERFRCNLDCYTYPDSCVNERLYMDMADQLVKDGYNYAGYEFVNIDDCWSEKKRDENGTLVADRYRFPSGIRALADYMHGRGLKLGIYADYGTETCEGYPGSRDYLQKDAETFASWGVDMVKLDGCNVDVASMPTGYATFGQYLNQTGRHIVYSCSWPAYEVFKKIPVNYTAVAKTCNIWRNYKDIEDSWDSVQEIIQFYTNNSGGFLDVQGPGSFNDPDMLIIGDYGLSIDEQKTQMAMWGILGAPLLMSNDLRHVPLETKYILKDFGVIRANQDRLGRPGRKIMEIGNVDVYAKQMFPEGKSLSYVFMNKDQGGGPIELKMPLYKLGLNVSEGYNVTEHLTGKYGFKFVGTLKPTDVLNITINPSGVYFGHADFDC